jgi:hypothetical protein
LVLEVPVVEQFAGPVGHPKVVGGVGPAGGELPYYGLMSIFHLLILWQ